MTREAVDVIRRSLELASADPSEMGVRLRMAGGAVRPRFQPEPSPDDAVVEVEGLRIFVAPELGDDIEIGVSAEHATLVVRSVL